MPRAPAAIAAALAALALGACGGEDGFEPAVPEGFFGINGQGLRALADEGETALLDEHLGVLAEGGVEFVRANTDWSRIEPEGPTRGRRAYSFAGLDAWVGALAEHGLGWDAAVMGVPTPAWAADPRAATVCGTRAKPARPGDIAALAGAIARRYGSAGRFWAERPELEPVRVRYELWNEPNLGSFWCPVPSPAEYARVALRMARAVRAADPDATLILGGLAGFEGTSIRGPGQANVAVDEFLRRTLAARPGLRRELDVLGVHAYGRTVGEVLDLLAYQREAARAAGLGEIPLSFNEFGWYTAGLGPYPPSGERERAAELAIITAAAARSRCGLDSVAPHTWITREQNVTDVEQWFGIADPETAEPHPSGEAYLDQVRRFQGRGEEAAPTDPLPICARP